MKHRIAAILLVAALVIGVLGGCGLFSAGEDENAVTLSNPAPLDTGSSYPGATYNEIVLTFLDGMFADDLITVTGTDGASYTITSEKNKDTYAEGCDYYLDPDVMGSIREEWETELWGFISDSMNYKSGNPCITFENGGDYKIWFYVEDHIIKIWNVNYYLTFQGDLGISTVVQNQYAELPTRTYDILSPSETVEAFFGAINEGDAEAANALLLHPVEDAKITKNVQDELVEVYDLGHIGDFPAVWCEKPYANRVFLVTFNQTTKSGTAQVKWDMYLVRETRDSEWKIAAYGVN